MGRKLISLTFTPSSELPELGDLTAFLANELPRQLSGFTILERDATLGEVTLDLVGRDPTGRLTAFFPAASREDRDVHAVLSRALLAAAWLEDNPDEATTRYAGGGTLPAEPLRLVLISPVAATPSRALTRALRRAGVETMPYTVYEVDAGTEQLLALSLHGVPPGPGGEGHGAGAASSGSGTGGAVSSEGTPVRAPAAVEAFIASLADDTLRSMSEQLVAFLLARFPSADGAVNPRERGFTFTVGSEHLATIRLDRNALWLEVGPDRIPTNKIRDLMTLERAMNLPSVLDALGSVQPS